MRRRRNERPPSLKALFSDHTVFMWMLLYFGSTVPALYVGLRLKVGLHVENAVI